MDQNISLSFNNRRRYGGVVIASASKLKVCQRFFKKNFLLGVFYACKLIPSGAQVRILLASTKILYLTACIFATNFLIFIRKRE